MVRFIGINFPQQAVSWQVHFWKNVPPWVKGCHTESPLLRLDQSTRLEVEGEGQVLASCFDDEGKQIFQIVTPRRFFVEPREQYVCDFVTLKVTKARAETQETSLTGVFAGLPRLPDPTRNLRTFLDSLPKLGGRR